MKNLLSHVPVGIRARVYRGVVAVGSATTAASVALIALGYPVPAAITATVVGACGYAANALAAVNTPVDFR